MTFAKPAVMSCASVTSTDYVFGVMVLVVMEIPCSCANAEAAAKGTVEIAIISATSRLNTLLLMLL